MPCNWIVSNGASWHKSTRNGDAPSCANKKRKQAWMAVFNVLLQEGFLVSTQKLSGGFSTQMQKMSENTGKKQEGQDLVAF